MARKPRIEFPGALYHVITRGNNRQRMFVDDEDYQSFLERLKFYKEVCKYFGRSEPVLSKSLKKIEVEMTDQESNTSKVIRKITSGIKKKYPPCFVREIK